MTPMEAWKVVHQLARAAPVVGNVGDARDEALEVLKQLAEVAEKPKSKRQ